MSWEITGNSGTDPNANFLGTTDSQPLVIKIAGQEALRVDPNRNVGIKKSNPAAPLDVAKGLQITGPILEEAGLRSIYHLVATGVPGGIANALKIYHGNSKDNDFDPSDRTHLLTISVDGHVGIGQSGQSEMPVNWLNLPQGGLTIGNGRPQDENFTFSVDESGGPAALRIYAHMFPTPERNFLTITKEGRVGIGTPAPVEKLHVIGNIRVSGDIGLENADCAEEFTVSHADPVEPGTVMVLDDQGSVRPSFKAYDKKVAGVVSGAGPLKPALVLDKKCSGGHRLPIALMGKVLCKVDAQFGDIEIGDLLTTSPTFGDAMKATDQMKAFGAVIGKALGDLREGRSMIPLLVALQ